MKKIVLGTLWVAFVTCKSSSPNQLQSPQDESEETLVTPEDAKLFIANTDSELRELWVAKSLADWEKSTNITEETETKASLAAQKTMTHLTKAIKASMKFDAIIDTLDPDTKRKIKLLRLSGMPAPSDPQKSKALAEATTRMESLYGKGKYCKTKDNCRDLAALEKTINESIDPNELLEAWLGWRSIGKEIKPLYENFVSLANEGAQGVGFADVGTMWRSGYDMSAGDFEKETERLWTEVKPLYDDLQCYVRRKLEKKYKGKVEFPGGTIPAHILGNMWGQSWSNIFKSVEPFKGQISPDVTPALKSQKYTPKKMVRLAESFFTSLGMDKLPATFWERSMFVKPANREVVCHASAWDLTYNDDVRIKMCIKVDQEDLITIHHELGHDYYFHYYHTLPVLYQDGAHDGFHEAIGDAIALSITPSYLKDVGLLKKVKSNKEALINQQLFLALDKIAFLPWGLLVDKWRWDVFSNKVPPSAYNSHWWALRKKFQGVTAPTARSADDFDPGAKYHIPANVPYARYFLSFIVQFQFHQALCQEAGHKGPLHECSIYGSEKAGAKFMNMLKMGASRPWPEALETVTGGRVMSGKALIKYFEPLSAWLKEQNKGQTCGWK